MVQPSEVGQGYGSWVWALDALDALDEGRMGARSQKTCVVPSRNPWGDFMSFTMSWFDVSCIFLRLVQLVQWHLQRIAQVPWSTMTGWWFGTMEFYDFPYLGNVIIPTDFHIFQRGWYTTNQIYQYSVLWLSGMMISHGRCEKSGWSLLKPLAFF